MEGLPKLPGYDFANRFRRKHHVPQSFKYINGYPVPEKPICGLGGEQLNEDSIYYCTDENDSVLYDPILTYGRVQKLPVDPFRPHFVLFDQKTLKFYAFFRQAVCESPRETFRIRYVNILYFLEDDTMTVLEPVIENCGYPQGRLVRRGKISKNCRGDTYSWKDLNIGIDLEIHGYVFHITDCDPFTKEFLLSNGIELNEMELPPPDPAMNERSISARQSFKHHKMYPVQEDKLRKYLEYQGKVLHFDCLLDEPDQPGGEKMTYKLFYFLEDDTVSIKELKENQEGRDYFPMLLRKQKLPKNWKDKPVTYPSICMEQSDHEVSEYYSPKDLLVGGTIFVYGRKFLLLGCDRFTRNYYERILKIVQPDAVRMDSPEPRARRTALPIYLGLGTPEDSIASHHNLVPKHPRKDLVTYLINMNKYLRYGCILDSAHPEDSIRRFVLSLSLADGTISIMESKIRNSGIRGGRFLSPTKVWKPDCDPNAPEYYTARDFYIDTIITVHSHRFKIISADLYVYRYMQAHPEMFAPNAIETVRAYLLSQGHLKEDLQKAIAEDRERFGCPEVQTEESGVGEVDKRLQGFSMDEKEQKEKPRPTVHSETHDCPSPVIPDEEIKKTYHSNEGQELHHQGQIEGEDVVKVGKSVRFEDCC
ncbi:EF-hand domain-containing protein 1-like [Toxorhynchites rutilus septentrionalis]|uniref:EF-hand domain-containing protein 1-like n=1 Tax=Toxorhynchites rutilus septentrionalis TaxID=329112 RepID=UPI00247A39D0|nr:EF-hand domain-containing protein 1-like [Toxorhynchites rutilus septentrionalis]